MDGGEEAEEFPAALGKEFHAPKYGGLVKVEGVRPCPFLRQPAKVQPPHLALVQVGFSSSSLC
jgi:hypothetical protein